MAKYQLSGSLFSRIKVPITDGQNTNDLKGNFTPWQEQQVEHFKFKFI